jgi:3-hydroxyisobutyrate dehydrogenase
VKAAFLGLGAIGEPMAARLSSRVDLVVWNRTRARADTFARANKARVAATPREAATGTEVVLTCLPTSGEVERLLDGPDGLEPGLGPGALLLDCTSGDPTTSRRIAGRLAAKRIGFADCPVSGGTAGAQAGTLTIMVGAEPGVFARAQPVLEAFGGRIEHMGPVGAGHAMKAVNNALLAAHLQAFGEGFAALAKAGVPARKAVEVLNASSGRSFVSESLVPDRVLTARWPQTFRLALLEKDVRIALGLLDETGVGGPLLHLVGQLFSQARAVLGEAADHVEIIRLIEQEAGVEIRG